MVDVGAADQAQQAEPVAEAAIERRQFAGAVAVAVDLERAPAVVAVVEAARHADAVRHAGEHVREEVVEHAIDAQRSWLVHHAAALEAQPRHRMPAAVQVAQAEVDRPQRARVAAQQRPQRVAFVGDARRHPAQCAPLPLQRDREPRPERRIASIQVFAERGLQAGGDEAVETFAVAAAAELAGAFGCVQFQQQHAVELERRVQVQRAFARGAQRGAIAVAEAVERVQVGGQRAAFCGGEVVDDREEGAGLPLSVHGRRPGQPEGKETRCSGARPRGTRAVDINSRRSPSDGRRRWCRRGS